MPFASLLCIDDAPGRSAALNMAIDETLLESASAFGVILRRYRWARPSVSLGYFTPHTAVRDRLVGRDVVRRWTGGGFVEHDGDWTYALTVPPALAHLWSNDRLYGEVHAALGEALRAGGVAAAQVEDPDALATHACFERAVRADVRVAGRKVAGAALRRHRCGLLLQGSVQGLAAFPPDLLPRFAGSLAAAVRRGTLPPGCLEKAAALARAKYATRAWTHRF